MAVGDLKARLRAKFTRRYSTTSSVSSTDGEPHQLESKAKLNPSLRSRKSHKSNKSTSVFRSTVLEDRTEGAVSESPELVAAQESSGGELRFDGNHHLQQQVRPATSTKSLDAVVTSKHDSDSTTSAFPTPNTDIDLIDILRGEVEGKVGNGSLAREDTNRSGFVESNPSQRRSPIPRRQSILPQQQTTLIKTLLQTEIPPPARAGVLDYFTNNGPSTISSNMVSRKIWVKRPGASATLVTINEDDLVDDVREMILKKYANSLGRNFDAPDVILRICPREPHQERTLGPEEPMCRTLDAYFPGGQTVGEALIIDVPVRRTPKPSPRGGPPVAYYQEDLRPAEIGSDYFPPMPVPMVPSPHLPASVPVSTLNNSAASSHHSTTGTHAISVLTTGHVPNLPSPGGSRRHYSRPRVARQHTTSPTVLSGQIPTPTTALSNGMHMPPRISRSRTHSNASDKSIAPPPPPLPTPPAQEVAQIQRISTPPPRVSSPRVGNRPKRSKKNTDHPSLPAGLLNGAVPPINVLIVEDNIINLKLLEAFMKRLKVRWQTAMNGKEAVTKWRTGGFHLVLMDIQLPVMNGLEATREIRRLEKLNSIGVFSSSASSSAPECSNEPEGDDKLPSSVLFKSPVIIVALTASSLQSDRHEALAAGCNDFLTKVSIYQPF
jgi:osomolarity two-component system response regulator SSK1